MPLSNLSSLAPSFPTELHILTCNCPEIRNQITDCISEWTHLKQKSWFQLPSQSPVKPVHPPVVPLSVNRPTVHSTEQFSDYLSFFHFSVPTTNLSESFSSSASKNRLYILLLFTIFMTTTSHSSTSLLNPTLSFHILSKVHCAQRVGSHRCLLNTKLRLFFLLQSSHGCSLWLKQETTPFRDSEPLHGLVLSMLSPFWPFYSSHSPLSCPSQDLYPVVFSPRKIA